jgi:NADH-quinone oxidoreductase subunit M
LMVIAALGTVFAAAYLLWMYQRTAFGTPPAEFSSGADSHGDHGSHAVPAHSLSAAVDPEVAAADHADDEHADLHDVSRVEWIAWTPMLVLILVFGVFPNLLFRLFDPPVTDLVARLSHALGR